MAENVHTRPGTDPAEFGGDPGRVADPVPVTQPNAPDPFGEPTPSTPVDPTLQDPPVPAELILDKFKTVDDLQQAYVELERKMGAPAGPAPTPPAGELPPTPAEGAPGPPQIDDGTQQQAVQTVLEKAGLNEQTLAQEIIATGSLSDESRKALNQQGIPDELIDTYANGYAIQVQQATATAHEIAGGADRQNAVLGWLAENKTPEQKAALNAQLNSPGWETSWRGLVAEYNTATGTGGQLLQGDQPAQTATTAFQSQAEIDMAMNKPDETGRKRLYEVIPEYRAEVSRRIAASPDNLPAF